jgi:CRP/FNR family transcriptional regulator, cyclic AMP receptor protein
MARLPAGRDFIRQGEIGQECFIITEGEVSVQKAGHEVAVLGPGSVVGEMALIGNRPRSATVTTLTPTTCEVLTGDELNRVLDIGPVARRLAETLAARLV